MVSNILWFLCLLAVLVQAARSHCHYAFDPLELQKQEANISNIELNFPKIQTLDVALVGFYECDDDIIEEKSNRIGRSNDKNNNEFESPCIQTSIKKPIPDTMKNYLGQMKRIYKHSGINVIQMITLKFCNGCQNQTCSSDENHVCRTMASKIELTVIELNRSIVNDTFLFPTCCACRLLRTGQN